MAKKTTRGDVVPKNSQNSTGKKKCIVLGFFFDQATDKILLVKTPQGKIYLPGGLSKCNSQQRKEKLTRYVYKKTGLWVKTTGIRGSRLLKSGKKIIIYDLSPALPPQKTCWQRTPGYKALWLSPQEIQTHSQVTPRIKEMIMDFLSDDNVASIKGIA